MARPMERTLPELEIAEGSLGMSRDWAEVLGAIEQAATGSGYSKDLPVLLDYVLRKTAEMVDMVWAAAWLFDEDDDSWKIEASLGLTPEASALRFRSLLPSRCGERGVPLLVNDLGQEDFDRILEEHYRMRSAMYVPMSIGHRSVGVLAIYSDRLNAYTQRDLSLLTAVGNHLGVAVAFAMMEERATQIAILEERDRHARDLHDGMHQILSSLRIYSLEAQRSLNEGDSAEALALLGALTTSIDECGEELREAICSLRGNNRVYRDIYEVAPRMRRRLEAAGVPTALSLEALELDASTSDALAWICREGTNNVLKHSNAHRVTIELRGVDGGLLFAIEDDGIGIDQTRAGSGDDLHIGLQVMRERAAAINGVLTIIGSSREGTRVECRTRPSPSPSR
jgi:signal transduction histidine kinase